MPPQPPHAVRRSCRGARRADARSNRRRSRRRRPRATIAGGGVVRGAAVPGGDVFRGLPYAAAPVGNLRWRAPRPPADWRGVRDATQFGPSCPQAPSPFAPPGPQSEDCLYLNVVDADAAPPRPPARTRLDPRRRPDPGRRPQLRRLQARGGRRRRRHDQLPAGRARLPRASRACVGPGRPGGQLRADGPASGAALGPAQHRAVRRRPAQRDDRRPVSRRPVGARPPRLARIARAVPARDRAERRIRADAAAARRRRGGRPGVRGQGGLPGPDRALPAPPAGRDARRTPRRRDPGRHRRRRAARVDRNGAGRRSVRTRADPPRHQPRRGVASSSPGFSWR